MDPHLRVVSEVKPPNILSYEQTIDLTQKGYFPNEENTPLTQEEINDLASYPINIHPNDWEKYRSMTLKELLEQFPELKYVSAEIDYDDALFYATRGILKSAPHVTDFIDRWKEYMNLSYIGKQMMNTLYLNISPVEITVNQNRSVQKRFDQNIVRYSSVENPHSLERYIVEFDRSMENQGTVIALGRRIGFDIESGFPGRFSNGKNDIVPYEQFIDKFYDIMAFGINSYQIKDIMQMTELEFIAKYFPENERLNNKEIDQLYSDRLYLIGTEKL